MKTRAFNLKATVGGGVLGLAGLFVVCCAEQDKFYSNVLRSDVFYQIYEAREADFLWVFDNSDSMTDRRKFVKDNIQTFLSILNSRKAINYQMAMVTTDYFDNQGSLVQNPSGLDLVKSTSADPVADFASIINNVQDTATSFWEQGLESAYQAVFRNKSKISREGVPLILIFLTDEQDWSCRDNCYGVEPENNTTWLPWDVSRYLSYFQNVKKIENSDVIVFPIVGVPGGDCEVASVGSRYIELQEKLGGVGVSGSICNSALEASYKNIAQTISDRGSRFPLSKLSNGRGFNVYVNGEQIPFSPENYEYEEKTNSIVFTGALPKTGSIIEISYSELTD